MLLVLAVAAAMTAPPKPTPFSNGRPPTRFQGHATVTLQIADQAGIDAICHPLFGRPPAGMRTDGCQTGDRVILPNPCDFPEDRYATMLCHELGHANGWSRNHDYDVADAAQPATPEPGRAAASTSPDR